jgi:hypothetical protein
MLPARLLGDLKRAIERTLRNAEFLSRFAGCVSFFLNKWFGSVLLTANLPDRSDRLPTGEIRLARATCALGSGWLCV